MSAGRNHAEDGLPLGGGRQDDGGPAPKGREKGAGGDAEEAPQRTLHQGKQTLHQLKQHGASLTNIEITEQNIKAFSVVAKKYDIDYALKKDPTTEPPHYYVFFKAKDKDQLQPAFKEFTAMTLDREKRPTIRERLAQAQEQSKAKHREREKVKTKDREVTR